MSRADRTAAATDALLRFYPITARLGGCTVRFSRRRLCLCDPAVHAESARTGRSSEKKKKNKRTEDGQRNGRNEHDRTKSEMREAAEESSGPCPAERCSGPCTTAKARAPLILKLRYVGSKCLCVPEIYRCGFFGADAPCPVWYTVFIGVPQPDRRHAREAAPRGGMF